MGKLLPNYKKAIIDDVTDSILGNTSHYYAFAAFSSNTLNNTLDDSFINDWQMLFGKKLSNTNIVPVVRNITWTSNTVYTQYDNTVDLSNSNFYVVVNQGIVGSDYLVYKCLNNNGNSVSTERPDQIQTSSFTKIDGYTWRYITSISAKNYDLFATAEYIPMYPNNAVVAAAYDNSGVENVVITNNGVGYKSYSYGLNITTLGLTNVNGNFSNGDFVYQSNGSANVAFGKVYSVTNNSIQVFVPSNYDSQLAAFSNAYVLYDANSNANAVVTSISKSGSTNFVKSVDSTIIQIENYESTDNDFYTGNAIYFYNTTSATSQIKTITKYVSNNTGNYVYLDSPANTTNITVGITQYIITPTVSFQTDGEVIPVAYALVNTSSKSIDSVKIIEPGIGVSWATATVQSNTSYPSSSANYAKLYPIVPPVNGHGSSPVTELYVQGLGINFAFNGNEGGTIPTETPYSKIGLIKNPRILNANGSQGSVYSQDTFNSVLQANVTPSTTFTVGDTVTGSTSNAVGTVVFSNSTTIFLTGDKKFSNNEQIVSSNGSSVASIAINTLGNLYTKSIMPLYVQDINTVSSRANNQSESFKLIVQI